MKSYLVQEIVQMHKDKLREMLENFTQLTADEQHLVETFGMVDINNTLIERGKKYGKFDGHARITQKIKRVMTTDTNWEELSNSQKESLEMIAHKIGRILNGDPDYIDHWVDIAGYATLVADMLAPEQLDFNDARIGGTD